MVILLEPPAGRNGRALGEEACRGDAGAEEECFWGYVFVLWASGFLLLFAALFAILLPRGLIAVRLHNL